MNDWPITIAMPLGWTIGGMSTWAVRLAAGLAKRGRAVRLVVHPPAAGHEPCPAMAAELPASVSQIAAPDLRTTDGLNGCIRLYRELAPTILLPGIWAESYAVAAALATTHADQFATLAWIHSDNPYEYAYLSHYEPIIARFIANSTRCRDEITRRLPWRSSDVTLVPHAVPLPQSAQRPQLPGRSLRLAYVGRMDHLVKRVLHLPMLARRLDELGVSFEMRLVGDGPQAAEMDAAIRSVSANLKTPGNRIWREGVVAPSRAAQIWSWADVSLLASVHEGLSMAMLEAMASGCCPVVTAVASGATDVIHSGENGILVPPDDVEAMAREVARLAGNPAQLAEMGHAARETICRHHSYDAFLGTVESEIALTTAKPGCSWPLDRSISVAQSETSRSTALPPDGPARLEKLLARLAAEGAEGIALYGGGAHTLAMASVLARSPVRIAAVIDDDPARRGEHLWGWPIIGQADVRQHGIRHVVISSWLNEDHIFAQCGPMIDAGVAVYRLYADARDAKSLQTTAATPQRTQSEGRPTRIRKTVGSA